MVVECLPGRDKEHQPWPNIAKVSNNLCTLAYSLYRLFSCVCTHTLTALGFCVCIFTLCVWKRKRGGGREREGEGGRERGEREGGREGEREGGKVCLRRERESSIKGSRLQPCWVQWWLLCWELATCSLWASGVPGQRNVNLDRNPLSLLYPVPGLSQNVFQCRGEVLT